MYIYIYFVQKKKIYCYFTLQTFFKSGALDILPLLLNNGIHCIALCTLLSIIFDHNLIVYYNFTMYIFSKKGNQTETFMNININTVQQLGVLMRKNVV